MAVDAYQCSKVAVQLSRRQIWMGCKVERIDICTRSAKSLLGAQRQQPTLSDDTTHDAHIPKLLYGTVSVVGPRPMQIRPAQEAPRPVSLPRLMTVEKFAVVDGSVGLVQGVGAGCAAVVCEARSHRDARPSKQHRPVIVASRRR